MIKACSLHWSCDTKCGAESHDARKELQSLDSEDTMAEIQDSHLHTKAAMDGRHKTYPFWRFGVVGYGVEIILKSSRKEILILGKERVCGR
jgi:hypothetical protein